MKVLTPGFVGLPPIPLKNGLLTALAVNSLMITFGANRAASLTARISESRSVPSVTAVTLSGIESAVSGSLRAVTITVIGCFAICTGSSAAAAAFCASPEISCARVKEIGPASKANRVRNRVK